MVKWVKFVTTKKNHFTHKFLQKWIYCFTVVYCSHCYCCCLLLLLFIVIVVYCCLLLLLFIVVYCYCCCLLLLLLFIVIVVVVVYCYCCCLLLLLLFTGWRGRGGEGDTTAEVPETTARDSSTCWGGQPNQGQWENISSSLQVLLLI